jgi:hypothetical protein
MAALPPAVLAYGHPTPLAAVHDGALPSSPQRDDRSYVPSRIVRSVAESHSWLVGGQVPVGGPLGTMGGSNPTCDGNALAAGG